MSGNPERFSIALVLFAFLITEGFTQEGRQASLRFVFYNTENFFDIHDDTLREDNDFLPEGLMRWNYKRYRDKINATYKVITAAGEWDPPALVGFMEVEKASVLQDLINNTYLVKYNYGIIHEESADPRGIDVCLIYRKDQIRLLSYRYIIPSGSGESGLKTRSVLYSKWLVDKDTIHIFLNHWPSRRGGVLAGEPFRESISRMVRNKADSISERMDNNAKIIIAGDFNCTPGDREISILTDAGEKIKRGGETNFINLSESSADKGIGTYRYMGTWEMIDQVIVSEWLLKCGDGYYTGTTFFKVFNADFLLKRDAVYPGVTPFSTYLGYRYQGGFSDHLPVILDLMKR